jgi:hypothetical protein
MQSNLLLHRYVQKEKSTYFSVKYVNIIVEKYHLKIRKPNVEVFVRFSSFFNHSLGLTITYEYKKSYTFKNNIIK